MKKTTLLLLFLCASAVLAQEITGSVVGTVQDASGAGVPGAAITITNTDRNAVVRTTTSDASGNYSAPLLPTGHYLIAVESKGFKRSVRQNIELNVNDKLTINFNLELGVRWSCKALPPRR